MKVPKIPRPDKPIESYDIDDHRVIIRFDEPLSNNRKTEIAVNLLSQIPIRSWAREKAVVSVFHFVPVKPTLAELKAWEERVLRD